MDKPIIVACNDIRCNVGHLKANHIIATRYDMTGDSFLGILHLDAEKIRLEYVNRG